MIETQVGKVKTGHTTDEFTVIIPYYYWNGKSESLYMGLLDF